MAVGRAVLVADSTATQGTGDYTLQGTTSGGYRTLAQAVAAGHVSDGDTVYYVVRDTGTEGASLAFERGFGVVGSGGTTITRLDANVSQSSNSDNRVSWGAGGSRQVLIVLDSEAVALLAEANTWTALQTFSAGARITNAATTGLQLFHSGVRRGEILTNTTGNVSLRLLRYQVDGSTVDASLDIANGAVNVTAGTLRQGGTAVALQGVLSAPAGTKLLFGSTPPTGWARVNVTGERMVRLAGSADTIGATGGSWTLSGVTVNPHTLAASEMPAHTHASGKSGFITSDVGGGVWATPAGGTAWIGVLNTASAGGGGSHTHGLSADGTWRPAYEIAAWGTKS